MEEGRKRKKKRFSILHSHLSLRVRYQLKFDLFSRPQLQAFFPQHHLSQVIPSSSSRIFTLFFDSHSLLLTNLSQSPSKMRTSTLISLFAISLAALAPNAVADISSNPSQGMQHRRIVAERASAPDQYNVKVNNVSVAKWEQAESQQRTDGIVGGRVVWLKA